ncbi:hypothetical protein AC578_57 [Pseudocercospora eumusae]|uniref:Uncharacterized protein n=1 Tax=Pseudocercospora eumusae TaxID=321146 RepID=A0A139HP66_9PEZI|nr:hypothetical protein AC578_57 [Pseudocercospora eumusae]
MQANFTEIYHPQNNTSANQTQLSTLFLPTHRLPYTQPFRKHPQPQRHQNLPRQLLPSLHMIPPSIDDQHLNSSLLTLLTFDEILETSVVLDRRVLGGSRNGIGTGMMLRYLIGAMLLDIGCVEMLLIVSVDLWGWISWPGVDGG